MLGWMKKKLESRLPGEISVTSDMQMYRGGLDFSWVSCNEVLDSTTPKEIFLFMIDIDF